MLVFDLEDVKEPMQVKSESSLGIQLRTFVGDHRVELGMLDLTVLRSKSETNGSHT
jgi:hypothetical protein